MARKRDDERVRGLPSLAEARAERSRAIVAGKVRLRSLPPQFWLWAGIIVLAIVIIYFKVEQGRLETRKSQVMAKLRAIGQTLGPKILPFRDKVEAWIQDLATRPPIDYIASDVSLTLLERSPAVYLRLRQPDAKGAPEIRKAALASLHDGFTSCFFRREKAIDPSQGPHCNSPADCQPGMLCNEYDVCTPPVDPYNMRLAYRSLRVLSDAWTDELHETSSELAITAYERDLERVTKEDVPVAAEILARARYFVGIVDEDPPEGLPPEVDGGEPAMERLQRVAHFARIGVWELRTGTPLVRLRRKADAVVRPAGERVITDEVSRNAQQRQANNCALALELRTALTPKKDEEEATDGGASDGGDGDAGVEGADASAAVEADAGAAPVGAEASAPPAPAPTSD
jgi:hypothetical protein